jgi:glycosyltransferase involved in cell wall biosynthesis
MLGVHRVALIASHVIQYQDPFFRRLAAEKDLDLTVFYCSRAGAEPYVDPEMQTELRWNLEMLSGYRHVFLRNFGFGQRYSRLINPGIVPAIVRGRFDAVLFTLGWGTMTSLLALAACRLSGTPILLFGDSSFPPPEDSLARKARALFLRTLFRLPTAFMVSGVLNAEYYRHYGADPSRFFALPFAIDNDRFAAAGTLRPGERDALRSRLGLDPRQFVIVFSGKLVGRKSPATILEAMRLMRHRAETAALFIGHGELRSDLEAYAREHGLNAAFAGFVNQLELPKHYALGDVFVLPSTYEPRGLVVNEAMAVGLPVIASDRVGAIGDLVREVFPAGDAAELARQLDALIDDPARLDAMRAWSREKIATWSYDAGVAGVLEALRACR